MFQVLPALIMLIVQGAYGAEVSVRHTSLLASLSAIKDAIGLEQSKEAEEGSLLSGEKTPDQLTAFQRAVISAAVSLYFEPHFTFSFPENECAKFTPIKAQNELELAEGHASGGRTRDGPALA